MYIYFLFLVAVTREDETSGQNNKSPNDLLNEIGYTKGRLACLDANDVPANEERMMLENNLRELERQLKMSTTVMLLHTHTQTCNIYYCTHPLIATIITTLE